MCRLNSVGLIVAHTIRRAKNCVCEKKVSVSFHLTHTRPAVQGKDLPLAANSEQFPNLFSAVIHCTAPSPIVKAVAPDVEQRHCSESDSEQSEPSK